MSTHRRPGPVDQLALFDADDYTPPLPAAMPYAGADPAAVNLELAGERYGWLAALLPAPDPLICEVHRRAMVLADPPPLWVCPDCDPGPAGAVWAEAA